jgi:hypothetical protein
LEHFRWKTSLCEGVEQSFGRNWGLRSGLDDDGVSGENGWQDRVDHCKMGKVPGSDDAGKYRQ